jgi:thiamine monophosphate synthase
MCIIGGLNKNNIDSVIEYQPDMIAISNGIFGQEKDKIQDSIKVFQEKMNAKSKV